ncbi:MAG: ribosomal protein S18-alanine N-acetyltransferase [Acidobacteria bacterium]|nr:ribosomal protein S18-alanine N-acetyltransferase [Acidobacteriota bacterium]
MTSTPAAGGLPPGYTVSRLMVEHDLDGLLAVEAESFTRPTPRETYEWEAAHSDVARVFVLRGPGGGIEGYCAAWLIFDELHVHNLAIRVASRGKGLAAGLLGHVLTAAAVEGARRATLEVRESNVAARRLYTRLGFSVAGRRRHYYTQPVEDALVLWHDGPLAPRAADGGAGDRAAP